MTSTGESRRPLTEETLYDQYLDACRAGMAEEPAVFCARYPQIGPDMRASIETLWAEAQARSRPAIDRLGDCEILEPLERGGMGLVYLARQKPLNRLVVVKVIRPEFRASETARARFRREADAAAKLHHPHLVQVLDVGEDDDVVYLVMEYVPGRSLSEALSDKPRPPWQQCVRWGLQLARALDYAHGEGVVHRDVKPSNVRIDRAGAPKLLDFGIARTEGATQAALTTTFAGSPLYAAPEQLKGKALDGRADVYGLGAMLYECVTGRPPFPGESLERVLREVLVNDPLPPRRLAPHLPKDLDAVLLKAIEKDPERRYRSAGVFGDDLERVLDDRSVRARPPGPLRRAYRWSRRHRATALSLAAVFLFLLFLGGATIWKARQDRREAREAVATARAKFQEYIRQHESTDELERKLARLKQQIAYRYLTDEEDELLNRHEVDVERRWRERDGMFHEILDDLRRAERLDPDVEGTDAIRAQLFAHKWRDSEQRLELSAAAFYKDQARRLDPSLVSRQEFVYRTRIVTSPPGATVDMFVYRQKSDEPRRIPVPIAGRPDIEPGSIVIVDGRRTAAPLLATPECRQGVTPLTVEHRDDAEYLALVRKPGYLDVRLYLIPTGPLDHAISVSLPKRGDGPEGFVRVVPSAFHKEMRPFWVMRHEVTAQQYREFLHATGDDKHAPRHGSNDFMWEKQDGRWVFPEEWKPDWPVLGVSWHDAQAYAAWRTKNDARFRYVLPTREHWSAMTGQGRVYVFGDHFRPKWVSSCFARPQAMPVPVMSYPIDESIYGVYDLAGSAFEWLDAWYDEGRNLRWLGGGSWGHTKPETFKIDAGMGLRPEQRSGSCGMRLVAVPK